MSKFERVIKYLSGGWSDLETKRLADEAIRVLEAAGKVDKDRAIHECMRSVDEYLGADGDEDWDAIKAVLAALPDEDSNE